MQECLCICSLHCACKLFIVMKCELTAYNLYQRVKLKACVFLHILNVCRCNLVSVLPLNFSSGCLKHCLFMLCIYNQLCAEVGVWLSDLWLRMRGRDDLVQGGGRKREPAWFDAGDSVWPCSGETGAVRWRGRCC